MIHLHQKTIKFLLIGLVVVIILIIAIVWVNQWYRDYSYNKKYPTKESVVNAYLNFSVKGDKKGLKNITPPDYIVDEAIDKKIGLYAGKKLEDLQIKYLPTESDHSFKVTIDGFHIKSTGIRVDFHDEFFLEYLYPYDTYEAIPFENPNGRWYLSIGIDKILLGKPPKPLTDY